MVLRLCSRARLGWMPWWQVYCLFVILFTSAAQSIEHDEVGAAQSIEHDAVGAAQLIEHDAVGAAQLIELVTTAVMLE